MGPSAETEFRGVFTQRQVNMFFFFAELANGRRDSFEIPLERDLDLFLGVGGSGRSPLNPPTPQGSGVGVRCERCGRARGSDTVRWKSRENDIVGPGAEEPKTVLVARVS